MHAVSACREEMKLNSNPQQKDIVMKKLILLVSFLVLNIGVVHSQNAVQLLQGASKAASAAGAKTSTKIVFRTVTLPAGGYMVGKQALLSHHPANFSSRDLYQSIQLATQKSITAKSIASPMDVYGPFCYLRKISEAAQDPKLVDPEFFHLWKHINQSGYFNGAHHIVNKSAIKLIHDDMKRAGANPDLESMQRDAPAIFHPMHGNPNYNDLFHNAQEQYRIYKQSGIKAVMEHQIKLINQINRRIGLDEISESMYDGLMHEAELWCEIYGLKF